MSPPPASAAVSQLIAEANAAQRAGRPDVARRHLEAALTQEPANPHALNMLGLMLLGEQQAEAGRALLVRATEAAAIHDGSSKNAPASASAATARPFQAATTLSSRPGCGLDARTASRAARTSSPGSDTNRSVDLPSSKFGSAVTPNASAADPSSSYDHTYVRPSTPSVSASSDDAKPPSAVRRSLSRKAAVSRATRR